MPQRKLSKLELRIPEALWANGSASIREIQEAFPIPAPPTRPSRRLFTVRLPFFRAYYYYKRRLEGPMGRIWEQDDDGWQREQTAGCLVP